jgi:TRAP-type C4-dicarboxylate transport system permease small subunit
MMNERTTNLLMFFAAAAVLGWCIFLAFGCGNQSRISAEAAAVTPAPLPPTFAPDGTWSYANWSGPPSAPVPCWYTLSWHCGADVPTPGFAYVDGSKITPIPCN